jgi:ABC-2 type transport system ATP-binding protein/lipopolysaccharide transport system ATP-binding protein
VASVRLDNVSVSFPIYDAASRSLKKRLVSAAVGGQIQVEPGSTKLSVVQALEDVSLTFKHGDRVGLVGHNGAGKTTLLRVIAGIYEPVRGVVKVEGQTAPLFDITLGMDPESTGYENILLRGLFLGLTHREIREKAEEIAEFTELGRFLELPMRTYSAGMRMRLAFAVSTSIQPDILLVDEGIGAGDAAFMEKANRRLEEFTGKAAIIVLASHSDQLVRSMCDKAVLMQQGRVVASGGTDDILRMYQEVKHGATR